MNNKDLQHWVLTLQLKNFYQDFVPCSFKLHIVLSPFIIVAVYRDKIDEVIENTKLNTLP